MRTELVERAAKMDFVELDRRTDLCLPACWCVHEVVFLQGPDDTSYATTLRSGKSKHVGVQWKSGCMSMIAAMYARITTAR